MTVVDGLIFAFAALAIGFGQKQHNAIYYQDHAAQLGLKYS